MKKFEWSRARPDGALTSSTGPGRHAGRSGLGYRDVSLTDSTISADGQPIILEGAIVEPGVGRAGQASR